MCWLCGLDSRSFDYSVIFGISRLSFSSGIGQYKPYISSSDVHIAGVLIFLLGDDFKTRKLKMFIKRKYPLDSILRHEYKGNTIRVAYFMV